MEHLRRLTYCLLFTLDQEIREIRKPLRNAPTLHILGRIPLIESKHGMLEDRGWEAPPF